MSSSSQHFTLYGSQRNLKQRINYFRNEKLTVITLLVFYLMMRVTSFPNEEIASKKARLENEKSYCSQESCQELRERVESLEEVVRAMVSTLSDEKNISHLTMVSQKIIGKNWAVRSAISSFFDSADVREGEESQQTAIPPVAQLESTLRRSII